MEKTTMTDSTIAFIGLGLIGGSIARAIRKTRPDIRIMAYMRSRSRLEQARKEGIVDVILEGIDENGNIRPQVENMVIDELRAHFRPEFLNRLDETILFKPLTRMDIARIVDLCVADLNKRLADRELTIELTMGAKEFVTDKGYDPAYGARPLKRYLQKNVETLAARIILGDGVREGSTIVIDVDEDKTRLIAYVE